MDDNQLVDLARAARCHAYAPYSEFAVGAALLTRSGKVFTGVNVENASYGLSMCAERSAVFAAVSAGETEFEAIAVVTRNGGSPCGACRQVLSEFGLETRVIIADEVSNQTIWTVGDLLPNSFGPEHLKR
jgi:cytidine deaminase